MSEAPPASTGEAMERARRHGRASLAEALAALRALLDAASLASTGVPGDAARNLAPAAAALDALRARLEGGADEPALLEAVFEALDAEISRWEERAREDGDARAVLRAFLGVREILWELGVRDPRRPRSAAPTPTQRSSRLTRVPVEG